MADKSPLPWFKYEVTRLGDEMDGLSDMHQGAYHRLIRRLWNRGPIPEEELRSKAPESWNAIRGLFTQFGANLSAGWLEAARESAGQYRASRVAGGVARAKQKLSKRSASAKHKLASDSDSSADALSISPFPSTSDSTSFSEGVQGEVRAAVLWPSFDDFYDLYDRKRGRPNAEVEWAKIPQRDREAIMQAVPAYVANNPKEYRKDPERYLKLRTWEDEVIPRNTQTNGKPSAEQRAENYKRILAERYPDQ